MQRLFLAVIIALIAYAMFSRSDDVTTLEYQNAAKPFVDNFIKEMNDGKEGAAE